MKFTPRRVVVAYIIAIVILALLAVTRLYVPKTAEEGEFYIPYLFVSGPVVWFAAIRMTLHVKMALSHHLSQPLGPLFWIVLVPGIFNILLGSLQWFPITLGVLKIRQSQGKEATQWEPPVSPQPPIQEIVFSHRDTEPRGVRQRSCVAVLP